MKKNILFCLLFFFILLTFSAENRGCQDISVGHTNSVSSQRGYSCLYHCTYSKYKGEYVFLNTTTNHLLFSTYSSYEVLGQSHSNLYYVLLETNLYTTNLIFNDGINRSGLRRKDFFSFQNTIKTITVYNEQTNFIFKFTNIINNIADQMITNHYQNNEYDDYDILLLNGLEVNPQDVKDRIHFKAVIEITDDMLTNSYYGTTNE